jgi:NADH:ubiquinone oxidoreductase subunit F (NADH-binding)/Pyruvate/2-oxoacid:ferredoxin oxidoreductase delta subunit/(2Fe-2S) ferredoxin
MNTSVSSVSEWLIKHVLLNPGSQISAEEKEQLALLRHEKVNKPVIFVGNASCGIVSGASATHEAIQQYIQFYNLDAEIVEVGCAGLCSIEPIVDVQLPGKPRISFTKVQPEKVEIIFADILHHIIPDVEVIGQYRSKLKEPWENVPFLDEHPFFKSQQRVLLKNCGIINSESIEEYIAHGGYKSYVKTITGYTPEKVCEIIEESGLRGRGGKGFPTAQKWKFARQYSSDQKYLICNAEESDPGAFMDRALMEGDPHLIIEGIAIASYAIGATRAYIQIRKDYPLALKRMEKAINQARESGLLGNNILNSGVNLNIILRVGAGAFVCGEETALISSLEGKRAMPNHKPPYPTQSGLFGKPTVINNVETLANVPVILQKGPKWYSEIGTEKSKGTKVFAIAGKVKNTGLIEVPMGTTLKKIVFDIAGGTPNGKAFKGLHLGGPSGNSLPENLMDLPVDFDDLGEHGIIMGSGGMIVMDESTCVLDTAKYFVGFMEKESCGKCIPCREGTRRMHEIMENVTRRPVKESGHETLERFKGLMQLESLAEVIRSTSLCGLGKTAPNPLLSTLKWFRDEYEEHIFDRKCRAGVCHDLRTFYIDVNKCTGCTLCEPKCPVNVIFGTPNNPYFIIEDKCIGCGICYDVCKFSAIFVR